MPVTALPCGCTLDTDFVSPDHRADGPPFHIVLKGNAQAYTPALAEDTEPEAEPFSDPEEKAEEKPKKKKW